MKVGCNDPVVPNANSKFKKKEKNNYAMSK